MQERYSPSVRLVRAADNVVQTVKRFRKDRFFLVLVSFFRSLSIYSFKNDKYCTYPSIEKGRARGRKIAHVPLQTDCCSYPAVKCFFFGKMLLPFGRPWRRQRDRPAAPDKTAIIAVSPRGPDIRQRPRQVHLSHAFADPLARQFESQIKNN